MLIYIYIYVYSFYIYSHTRADGKECGPRLNLFPSPPTLWVALS